MHSLKWCLGMHVVSRNAEGKIVWIFQKSVVHKITKRECHYITINGVWLLTTNIIWIVCKNGFEVVSEDDNPQSPHHFYLDYRSKHDAEC